MGRVFAILAALCNSFIGIFSNNLYSLNMDSMNIAFFRCFIAFLVISLFMLNKRARADLLSINKESLMKYGLLSFIGIFIMYTFEILALKFVSVSLVSFLLYSSGILTIVLGCIFLKEQFNISKVTSVVLVFFGVAIMFIFNSTMEGNILGLLFALIAGTGYALFLFFMKKFNVESSLKTLFYLFLFGSIYLIIPLLVFGQIKISAQGVPYILALAVIPTIGGFYFTNKALSIIEAGKVQLFEMTEPFIATILAYFILGQIITGYDLVSGIIIMVGLLVLEMGNIRKLIRI